jgi:hypothetical protein
MLSGRTALIIAGVGASIIVFYMFYLVLKLNCRLDTKLKGGAPISSCSVDRKQCQEATGKPQQCGASTKVVSEADEGKCPKCPGIISNEHAAAECNPDVYIDFAGELVKRLMASAKKVTHDRGLDKKYYNDLLKEIYLKFYRVNAGIVNKEELEKSNKFLKQIQDEVEVYQEHLKGRGKPVLIPIAERIRNYTQEPQEPQKGGSSAVDERDISKVINDNEHAIYEIYPSLAI